MYDNHDSYEICLLNDSFPPLIDGVANTVMNYARVLANEGWIPHVITPDNPDKEDSCYDYDIIRYPSVDLRKIIGYPAGNPFSFAPLKDLRGQKIDLIHSHCPFASNILAKRLQEHWNVPMVLTYHTKFDIDISNLLKLKFAAETAYKTLVESVNLCDELWVVSRGAGESIRNIGYEGDYIVMENGVDIPKGRSDEKTVTEVTAGYDLPYEIPVFLFVGRLMWYKGIKIILDALAALKSQDIDFRMVFVGGGTEADAIKQYARNLGLSDKVFFTGAIHDRHKLVAWYTRADLFLFPSTYDTNGLVVREAAAASLGSVLVGGSCASEGVTNGKNALLIEENAASLAVCLAKIINNRDMMRNIGVNAGKDLYLSWDDAIGRAIERYRIVMDNYARGYYRKRGLARLKEIIENEIFE